MGGINMESLIYDFIKTPRSGVINFQLGVEYKKVGHYAAAMTCFMRCAEYGDLVQHKVYIYESLLQISILIGKIGNRNFTEEGYLLHAITFDPTRPEAYWLMSMLYEREQKWQESYMMACLGLECKWDMPNMSDINYEGKYMLLFQKAVNGYRMGYGNEAREIFISLPEYSMNDTYKQLVQNNISNLGSSDNGFLPYTKDKAEQLRFKFKGYNLIERNYSQMYQDMFVLSMLDGLKNGYYLEIGSADPFKGSNTYLLESQFGWKGISIEIQEELVKKFREARKNTVLCRDATTTNYDAILKGTGKVVIDYLQIDCEPPATNYNILLSIPFEKYTFKVITYEHDNYADVSKTYKQLSREFLKAQGYKLIVSNVAANGKHDSEDWWIHPDLVDPAIVERMMNADNTIKHAERYMTNQ